MLDFDISLLSGTSSTKTDMMKEKKPSKNLLRNAKWKRKFKITTKTLFYILLSTQEISQCYNKNLSFKPSLLLNMPTRNSCLGQRCISLLLLTLTCTLGLRKLYHLR